MFHPQMPPGIAPARVQRSRVDILVNINILCLVGIAVLLWRCEDYAMLGGARVDESDE